MVICHEINEAMQVDESTKEWLGDSGALAHITNSDYLMMNMRKYKVLVTVSTGEVTMATTVRDIILISEKGEKVKLLNVLYVPCANRNLLSTNRFTQISAELFANKERMLIKKDSTSLTLDSTGHGNN